MTVSVKGPLSSQSEVVNEKRRWNQDWYTWLSDLTSTIRSGGGGGTNLGIINVKTDFDAIGDDVADDTAAIQAALDSGQGNPIVVYFPLGTYKVNPPNANGTPALVIHYDNITMVGAGPGSSIIKVYASGGRDPNTNFDAVDWGVGQSVWRGHGILVQGNPQDAGARAVDFASTGKYYFECVNNFAGIGLSAANYLVKDSSSFGLLGQHQSVAVFVPDIYINSLSPSGNIGPSTGTDTIAIAVDVGAKLFWAKNLTAAGNWNNNALANPATGVGGLSIASVPTPMAPTLDLEDSCGGTMNFGATPYAGVVPAGFANWPGSPTTTLNSLDYDQLHIVLSNGNLTVQRVVDTSLTTGRSNIVIENLRLTLQCLRSTANWPFGGTDPPFQPSLFGATADGWDLSHKGIFFDVNKAHANVRLSRCEIDGSKGEMIYYGGGAFTNLTIENNLLHDCNADIISCMAGPMFIRDNVMHDGTNMIENSPFNQDLMVSGNYCYNFNNGAVITNQTAPGGDATLSGKTIIRDNVIVKAYKFGCFIQNLAKQVWVHHNIFSDCGSSRACIGIAVSTDVHVNSPECNVFIEDNQFYADTLVPNDCISLNDSASVVKSIYIRRNRALRTSNAYNQGYNFTSGVTYSLTTGTLAYIEDNDFSILDRPSIVFGSGSVIPICRRNVAAQATPLLDRMFLFTQFDKTSNVTLSNAGFQVPIGYGTFYIVYARLLISANASGGAQVALGFSGAAPQSMRVQAKLFSGTTVVASGSATAINTLIAGATSAVDLIEISGYINTRVGGGGSGLLDIQFAQNASFGTASSVIRGSFLDVTESQLQTSFD